MLLRSNVLNLVIQLQSVGLYSHHTHSLKASHHSQSDLFLTQAVGQQHNRLPYILQLALKEVTLLQVSETRISLLECSEISCLVVAIVFVYAAPCFKIVTDQQSLTQ